MRKDKRARRMGAPEKRCALSLFEAADSKRGVILATRPMRSRGVENT
jgi:hypothetical protein